MMQNYIKKRRFGLVAAILILITVISTVTLKYIESVVMPRGAEVLHSYAETNMFEILNSSVSEVLEKYARDYSSLVDVTYAESGEITSIKVNYLLVNKLKSEISLLISRRLSEQDEIPVYVPVGAFSQNMYLMGKGPQIKFVLMQRGNIHTDFYETFQSAGVNQTMHTLKITMEADVALMLPFYTTNTHMKTSAILSQTVINGDCPDQYLRLNGGT